MKKIVMTFVAAVMAVSASAQVYVGGNVGIASYDPGYEGSKSETVYSVLPEIGYSFDSDWAAGVAFGWSKGALRQNDLTFDDGMTHTFEVNPYVRYTAIKGKVVNFFIDGAFGYKHYNDMGNSWSLGLKPGVAVNVDKFSFVAHVGFVGYENFKPKGGDAASVWGVDFDGNNISLGVYYNF
ncbi:MAG: outer membrane beta-barrel protein [Prevotellaceae bacterium]|nr:outer membrane beta-barrel protein [Prevotellaceae bacterium]